jgi:hypothetical protein
MIANEKVDAVIALGAVAENSWGAPASVQAALTGLIQISLQTNVPVIPAIVAAESVRDAKQAIKNSAAKWAASVFSLTEIRGGTAPPFGKLAIYLLPKHELVVTFAVKMWPAPRLLFPLR